MTTLPETIAFVNKTYNNSEFDEYEFYFNQYLTTFKISL